MLCLEVSLSKKTGHIYVSDTGNHRILMFFENGDFLKQFGDSHLDSPYSVLVHERSVYVTDWGHHAIFIFSLPELFMIKRVDMILGHENFKIPHNIAISPNQYFYMPSTDKDRIQILNRNLEIQCILSLRRAAIYSRYVSTDMNLGCLIIRPGIAVLKHNKIACLSLNKGFSLQIFSAS